MMTNWRVPYLYTGFSYHEPSLKVRGDPENRMHFQIFRHGILQTVGWNETLLRAWIAVLTAWQSADVLVSTRGLGLFTFLLLQSCVWILNVSCLTVMGFFLHFLLVLISFRLVLLGVYCSSATFVHRELAAEPVVDESKCVNWASKENVFPAFISMWFAKSSCSQRSRCIRTFGSVWFAKNSCSQRSRCVLTFSSVWFVKNSCSPNLPWYNGTGWLGVKHQVAYLLFPKCTSDVYFLVESSSLKCGCAIFITGHCWKWGFWDFISLLHNLSFWRHRLVVEDCTRTHWKALPVTEMLLRVIVFNIVSVYTETYVS